jgi:ParB family chromosome partitioning protein
MREAAPKLGRGLASLLGQDMPADTPTAAGPLRQVSLSDIAPNPHQPRAEINPASLADLAASIAQQGLLQPVLVREVAGKSPPYELVAGERRWRAAAQAGLTEIPCVVRDMSDSDVAMAALVENLQREDLNPLDEAEGFQRALDRFGLTQETLGRAVGKSRSHVANTLRLLNLPESVRQDLRAGRLSAGHARALLAHPDPQAAARSVIARGLNVRQTEALASERRDEPQPRPRDPDLAALEAELSEKLGLAISILDRGGAGRVSIQYRSLDQLDGIVTLLSHA